MLELELDALLFISLLYIQKSMYKVNNIIYLISQQIEFMYSYYGIVWCNLPNNILCECCEFFNPK